MDRFLEAWPQRDLPIETYREKLKISAQEGEHGWIVHVEFLGSQAWSEPFTDDEVETGRFQDFLDNLATRYADQEEADRWSYRGAWREWRNPD
ncbi:MAG: hypothetical protein AB7N61_25200 [Acidimicrobiia bacterium]